jgi:hypothetical protein
MLPRRSQAANRDRCRCWRGLAALIGGFILRAVLILSGRKSAERPQDYFRLAQPENVAELAPREPAARGPIRPQAASGRGPAHEMVGR